MGLIAGVIIAGVALVIVLFWFGTRDIDGSNILAVIIGICLSVVLGAAIIVYVAMAFSWFAAESKAAVVNREFGTTYTQEEIFWAEDVIDTIREIKRQRFEVNGDIMRGSPEQTQEDKE